MSPASDALREQLSAFCDGELDRDASRFLQARLAHDEALRETYGRWQVIGATLRAQPQAGWALPVHTAVMQAITDGTTAPTANRHSPWPVRVAGMAAALALGLLLWPSAPVVTAPAPRLAAGEPVPPALPAIVVAAPVTAPQDSAMAAATWGTEGQRAAAEMTPHLADPLPEPRVIGRPWPRGRQADDAAFTVGYRAPAPWPVPGATLEPPRERH